MTSPRSLLALALMLSVLSASGGRGTLAYFTSTATSPALTFSSGQIDITPSAIASSGQFNWSTAGGGTDCMTLTLEGSAADTTAGAMVPGQFCVAKITVSNTATNSVDAWMRMRLVRDTTATDTTATALNDRLRFYMSEYAGSGDRSGAQTANCTTTNFAPASALSATVYAAATDTTSTATIAGSVATGKSSSVIVDTPNVTTNVNRVALRSLGDIGKNIGQHPAVFAPADSTANSYFSGGTVFDPALGTAIPVPAAKGMGLVGGAGGGLLEASFITNDTSTVGTGRNSFNLVGNDQVTNPRQLTTLTNANGHRAYSTNTEAELPANTTRYYCAAIFFPSDTGISDTGSPSPAGSVTSLNSFGDNLAANTSNAYRLVVTAAQKAGRSVN